MPPWRALVIQHSPIETVGPSYARLLKEEAGFDLEVCPLYQAGPDFRHFALPSLQGVDLLVVMGGPMAVYDNYPALVAEEEFLRQAIAAGVPVFGVCLGAQLLSQALGGHVEPSRGFQFGLRKLHITEAGDSDPVMGRLSVPLVPTLHGDCFTVPPGGVLLAQGDMLLRDGRYRRINMAYRHGNSYGFQFEPQLTLEEFLVWNREMYSDYASMGQAFDPAEEAARNEREFRKYASFYEEQSRGLLRAFLAQAGLS